MQLPDSFHQRMQATLGNDFPLFLKALEEPPPVSLRLHPLKIVNGFDDLEQVKWHPEGRYLPERPVFTLDPAFHAGAYYVQEASSMFIGEALSQSLDVSKKLRVLDLCAAPGGKSALLASAIGEDSLLLSNEVIHSRIPPLRQNLEKWGYPNTAISNHDPADFKGLEGFFDVVLVDAPCSGEGLFRKDPKAMNEWSENNVQRCEARQQRILSEAMPLVRAGGVLLYSTCTFNDFENEGNVWWMLEQKNFEFIKLKIPVEWGIVEKESGYQFYPHRLKGEGFFIACLRKKEDAGQVSSPKISQFKDWQPLPKKQLEAIRHWLSEPERFSFFVKPTGDIVAIPTAILDDCLMLDRVLKKRSFAVTTGEMKGKDFIPSHAFALSNIIHPELSCAELDRELALQFLKKENFFPEGLPRGWQLARYNGLNLGWMKVLNNRINNYLPNEWRIRINVIAK